MPEVECSRNSYIQRTDFGVKLYEQLAAGYVPQPQLGGGGASQGPSYSSWQEMGIRGVDEVGQISAAMALGRMMFLE
jgi:hypothetical protein